MESHDKTPKVVPFINDNDEDNAYEKGKCFLIVNQAMTLDFKIPVPDRDGVWIKTGYPYTSFDKYQHTPDGIEITTDRGEIIIIEGDRLDRLYSAIGDHTLRTIRPILEGETINDDEPRPTKIIFIVPKSNDESED